jgi:hypothetical protein
VDAPLGHGQSIYVTGNGPALGDDDPLNGVALYTTPSEYPRWSSDWGEWEGDRADVSGGSHFHLTWFGRRLNPIPSQSITTTVSVGTNAELTYKYAIFEGVKFSHWEPIGTNKEGTRTIRVQEDQVETDERMDE